MPSQDLPSLLSLASWRIFFLIFALINYKSVPLAWHIRLFYRMFQNWHTQRHARRIESSTETASSGSARHPLFQPVSITSHAPLLETDYNLHKSNSTYFSDLDESRTALVTKLLLRNMATGKENLEREGHKGPLNVILGSVHTSFYREIKPYEAYVVRSRILSWDRKWIVIGSWFVRPARAGGKGELVLASALSKYVVKKGKFTVAPERCFRTAGWLPDRPEGLKKISENVLQAPEVTGPSSSSEETSLIATPQEGLAEPLPETVVCKTSNIVKGLESATQKSSAVRNACPGRW